MIQKAQSKADYIKFQLYNSDNLNPEFLNYKDKKQFYKDCELRDTQVEDIFNQCDKVNITPMFTIFTRGRLNILERFSGENFAIKIASPDMSNYNLIDEVKARLPKKLLIVSTGMHDDEEIEEAKKRYKDAKFLYCISKYPTSFNEIDYQKMKNFDGFSDHTIGFKAYRSMLMLNPNLEFYEKHYTLSRSLYGPDQAISIEAAELDNFITLKQEDMYKKRWRDDYDREA